MIPHRRRRSRHTGKLVVLTIGPSGTTQGIPGTVARAAVTRRFPQAAGIAAVGLDMLPAQMQQVLREPSQSLKPEGTAPELPTFLYITRRTASGLLGADIDNAKPGALGTTVTATPRFKESPVEFPVRNVVAMIPGSDPKMRAEFVAIGSHNDHVGLSPRAVAHDSLYVVNHLFRTGGADDRPPQLDAAQQAEVNALLADIRRRTNGASARPDSIFNGADDDGSGSMSMLEMAQYFAAQKVKPKRSLLFVWHNGEEAGLYGAEWYTDHTTVPSDAIVRSSTWTWLGEAAPPITPESPRRARGTAAAPTTWHWWDRAVSRASSATWRSR